MPAVSVIIPVFNRVELLCETLHSVWNQIETDYEIVVVDDGSDEDVAATIQTPGRVLNYHRLEHRGKAAARNTGLEISYGDYIALLDSDDLWESGFISKMVGALEQNPKTGFAYCDYATFDENGAIHNQCLTSAEKAGGRLFDALLEKDFLCVGGVMVRRDCLKRIGVFDRRLTQVEDWDLWLRLAHKYDAVCVDQPLLRVRLNSTNPSRDPGIIYPENLLVLDKVRANSSSIDKRTRSALRRRMMQTHKSLAFYYSHRHQPLFAARHLAMMCLSIFR